jgi:hypothetical protein
VPIDSTDRNDVLAVIRELFAAGGARDRKQAIRDVSVALGYRRLGPKIVEIVGNDLKTAVRRGILERSAGEYSLLCRTIDEYTRDHLVAMLVFAMGSGWQTRATATTVAARYLGYRRTGRKIAASFKSAINAAIRRGLIERDGPDRIRRAR